MAESANETKEVRADPTFKIITTQAVQEVGIKVIPAEFPQALSADLALEIPDGIEEKLGASLFNFLIGYLYAIVEFKGENDPLTMTKFLLNLARTALFCAQHPDVPVKKVLNLYVCSKFPEAFLEMANTQDRPTFVRDPARPWLWQAHLFCQEISIVVCRDLPLDPVYYNWLIFAPSSTTKWRDFVRTALKEGRRDIIEIARKLRPKELNQMEINVEEILRQLPQEELDRIERDRLEAAQMELEYRAKKKPQDLMTIMDNLGEVLEPEQLRSVIKLLADRARAKDTTAKKPRSKPAKTDEGTISS